MKTNTSLTIYNKYTSLLTRLELYQRADVADVAWENRKAANALRTGGQIAADQATIYIPFERGENYLSPKAWQALLSKTGKWTLRTGDVIVKGTVSDEITNIFTLASLQEKYNDVLTITSVDTMDMGSLSMRHWQVGAK